jgi:hypothetical protein
VPLEGGLSVRTLAGQTVRLADTKNAERCGNNVVLATDDLNIPVSDPPDSASAETRKGWPINREPKREVG